MNSNMRKFGASAMIEISAAILCVLCLLPADMRAENVVAADTTKARTGLRTSQNQMTVNTAAIIKPFQNSADSVSIDELTVENGEDRIAVYGALNITRDKVGLRRAQELKVLLDETVKRLSSEKLPDHIVMKPVEKTDNPFR